MDVMVWHDYSMGDLCIIFGDKVNNTVFNFKTFEAKHLNPGERIPEDFVFKLPFNFQTPFLEAMQQLIQKVDLKPNNYSLMEGELKATKYHLEDMREMLHIK